MAEDKKANYRSQSVCDAGVFYYDNCDNPLPLGPTLDFLPSHNLGQSFAPFLGANPVYSRTGRLGYEYYWVQGAPFLGWYTREFGSYAGPYYNSLLAFNF